MRHVRYMAGIMSIALLLNITGCIGDGCCGTKAASTVLKSEKKCVVCGKPIKKDKGVNVDHEGMVVTLCCKDCVTTFKKDPCKFCKDEEHHH